MQQTFTKESLIKSLKKIRDKGWIRNYRTGNHGAIGNILEDLLGIEENNLPIPNAGEWELKTQKVNSGALITLFHMEPSPQALKFVPNLLLPSFGWKHKQAGHKYADSEKSFRQTLNYGHVTDRGFFLKYDEKDKKICFSFDLTQVSDNHLHWKQELQKRNLRALPETPYWSLSEVYHKIGAKLTNCFLVTASTKKEDKIDYVKYENIYMLRNISYEKVIAAFLEGKIYLDFDARTGHNHGTKFRIREKHLKELYEEIVSF